MARNRRQRAAKRNAERRTKNALSRGLAASQAARDQPSPPPTKTRQQPMIDRYFARGNISERQKNAGQRLFTDWRGMGQSVVKAASIERVSNGHANPTLRQVECHRRYAAAMQALGQERSAIVVHVCLYDHTASDWAVRFGRCSIGDAMDMLKAGLDALDRHYADTRKAEREREMEVA